MLILALLLAAQTPDVDSIIEKHIAARGGRERIAALQTLVVRGEYREGDHVSPDAVMALMRPYYKLVGDPDKPVRDFAEGYDGSAWEYYADPGIVVRTVGPASAASRHRARFDHPLVALREHGATATLAGIEGTSYQLLLTLEDGFREEIFIDRTSYLIVAERKVAPIHAFGETVTSETRFSDFRPVEGVLFSFLSTEVEIATGKVLSTFTTKSIVANHKYDPAVFSPPEFKRTALQNWIEQLFAERDDIDAVRWSYRDFRNANPGVDTHEAAEVAGYQILKMKQHASAIALLEANARDYPRLSTSAFGLGRAYRTSGDLKRARADFERALQLDPKNARAAQALAELSRATPGG
jgi:hypothetical protein